MSPELRDLFVDGYALGQLIREHCPGVEIFIDPDPLTMAVIVRGRVGSEVGEQVISYEDTFVDARERLVEALRYFGLRWPQPRRRP